MNTYINNLNFWGSHLIRYGVVMKIFLPGSEIGKNFATIWNEGFPLAKVSRVS